MRSLVLGSFIHAHSVMVEDLPAVGQSVTAQAMWAQFGGKGLNLALGLQRLQGDVALLMGVGQDAVGREVKSWLAEQGITNRHVLALGAQSGFGVGLVAADGHNMIAIYPGANALLTADHVDAFLRDCAPDHGLPAWLLAQFEIDDAVILAAFRQARARGMVTFLNPSPWRPLSAELLALTDVMIVNEVEAESLLAVRDVPALAGQTLLTLDPADWARYFEHWIGQVGWRGRILVVTLGSLGAVVYAEGQVYAQAAFSVDAVDSIGAGDAFACGFIHALQQGKSITQALRAGNACGAIVTRQQGVLDALPSAIQLVDFLQLPPVGV